jgi:hypothetical protein
MPECESTLLSIENSLAVMAQGMAHAIRIIIVSAFVGKAALAVAAAESEPPSCSLHPAAPDTSVKVEGFPAERLYLYPKHPSLCRPGGNDCVITAYVIAGDELKVGNDCNDWTFVSFTSKRKKTSGWVATRRLPVDLAAEVLTRHVDIDTGGKAAPATVSNPDCVELQAAWNQSLANGGPPSLNLDSQSVESTDLPEGVAEFADENLTVADSRIQGKAIKVVSYTSGGTCHDSVVEIWTQDFSDRISPFSSSRGTGMANYSGDSLLELRGKTYFSHADRGAKNISLYSFDSELTPHLACQLIRTQRVPEGIQSFKDPALCQAVLAGGVTGAAIDDIDPVPVPASAELRGEASVVARGRLDIDNDGKPDDVGIVEYDESSDAGCGFEFHASWPVKLGADNLPVAGSALNDIANMVSGTDTESRLFTYEGLTYYELRSRPSTDVPQHSVWRLTSGAPIQACVFEPVRYEAESPMDREEAPHRGN